MVETKKDANKKECKTSDVDGHIANRYDIKKRLGKGAYGIVWKAVDNSTKEVVAVKKIFEAFRNQTDAQRTFREIMFLQAFKNHPNIITLRGIHKASNNKDIYLVFDYMDTDLHHVIKRGTVLKDVHKRYIMYQLFRATMYLHSGNVIHRDQKPSNVLINTECKIKIADFGLARSLTHSSEENDQGILTDYVATRWYRAPEILVASKKYTKGVDMWSLGCILGEMLVGKPLFPGSSTVNQMERIMAVLPKPTKQEIFSMCTGFGKGLLEGYNGPKTTLKEVAHGAADDAMDLLHRLLQFDPAKRLTAENALKHLYVARYGQGREVILDHDVIMPVDDDIQLSVADYRNKLYEMIESARVKRRQSKADLLQQSPEETKGQSDGTERRPKPSKTIPRQNFSENWQKAIDNTYQRNNQQEAKAIQAIQGGLRPLEASLRRNNRSMGQQKSGGLWNEKPAKPSRSRVEDGSGDASVLKTSLQPQFTDAIAQVREKLRRVQAINSTLGSLPRVSYHKKEAAHNAVSPPLPTRYPRQQGIMSTSAIQDIRNVLKQ